MTTTNEPKYRIATDHDETNPNARPCIVNRQSGEPIPDDEPIFILRGRDIHALAALEYYRQLVLSGDQEHVDAVTRRVNQFARFRVKNAQRMKAPDTVLTDDWNNL